MILMMAEVEGLGDPGVFDDPIEKIDLTKELSLNDKVKDYVGENADELHEISRQLFLLMTEINKLSQFAKADKETTDTAGKMDLLIERINKILKKIANINCITKCCTSEKSWSQIEELKDELEKYIEKIKSLTKMLSEKVKWIIKILNQKRI